MAYKMMISMNPAFQLLMQFNTEKKKKHKKQLQQCCPIPQVF